MRFTILYSAFLAAGLNVLAADQDSRVDFRAKLNRAMIDVWPGGGLFPQVVDSSGWKTSMFITNLDATTVNVGLMFFNDRGDEMFLPIQGRQVSDVAFTLEPDRSILFETEGVGDLKQGYGLLVTCNRQCSDPASEPIRSRIGAIATFRQRVSGRPDNEAVVPLEQAEEHIHIMFDSRAGLVTGIALMNLGAESITVTIRDHLGAVLVADSLQVGKWEKSVFALETKYPAVVGKYGIVEFQGYGILAMGLRFNPDGAFTSSHSMSVH